MTPGRPVGGQRRAKLDGVGRALASRHDPEGGDRAELPTDLPGSFAKRLHRLPAAPRQVAEDVGPGRARREGWPEIAVERMPAEGRIPGVDADGDDEVGVDEGPGDVERDSLRIGAEIGRP